jgi:hypothetical protein
VAGREVFWMVGAGVGKQGNDRAVGITLDEGHGLDSEWGARDAR